MVANRNECQFSLSSLLLGSLYNQPAMGGEIGRRARLRIPKSAVSKRRFTFQEKRILREENVRFPRN
jgi:hypothetical protein